MRKYYHKITVEPKARGFVVRVGCQTLVYRDLSGDVDEMIKDFAEYVKDPQGKQRWYDKTYGDSVDKPKSEIAYDGPSY